MQEFRDIRVNYLTIKKRLNYTKKDFEIQSPFVLRIIDHCHWQ